jgi:hypothetical protein
MWVAGAALRSPATERTRRGGPPHRTIDSGTLNNVAEEWGQHGEVIIEQPIMTVISHLVAGKERKDSNGSSKP